MFVSENEQETGRANEKHIQRVENRENERDKVLTFDRQPRSMHTIIRRFRLSRTI